MRLTDCMTIPIVLPLALPALPLFKAAQKKRPVLVVNAQTEAGRLSRASEEVAGELRQFVEDEEYGENAEFRRRTGSRPPCNYPFFHLWIHVLVRIQHRNKKHVSFMMLFGTGVSTIDSVTKILI
jgi:hypothetical protein